MFYYEGKSFIESLKAHTLVCLSFILRMISLFSFVNFLYSIAFPELRVILDSIFKFIDKVEVPVAFILVMYFAYLSGNAYTRYFKTGNEPKLMYFWVANKFSLVVLAFVIFVGNAGKIVSLIQELLGSDLSGVL